MLSKIGKKKKKRKKEDFMQYDEHSAILWKENSFHNNR